jgi:hypothetical protein
MRETFVSLRLRDEELVPEKTTYTVKLVRKYDELVVVRPSREDLKVLKPYLIEDDSVIVCDWRWIDEFLAVELFNCDSVHNFRAGNDVPQWLVQELSSREDIAEQIVPDRHRVRKPARELISQSYSE